AAGDLAEAAALLQQQAHREQHAVEREVEQRACAAVAVSRRSAHTPRGTSGDGVARAVAANAAPPTRADPIAARTAGLLQPWAGPSMRANTAPPMRTVAAVMPATSRRRSRRATRGTERRLHTRAGTPMTTLTANTDRQPHEETSSPTEQRTCGHAETSCCGPP